MQSLFRAGALVRSRLPLLRGARCVVSAPAGPLAKYREMVAAGAVTEDEQQLQTLESFDRLHRELLAYRPPGLAPVFTPKAAKVERSTGFWGSLFSSAEPGPSAASAPTTASSAAPNGIYLYGGPGCGKTFMMDMFYDTLPIERKRRIHFNDFMIDTHKQLHQLKKSNSQADYILDALTDELIKKHYVLCFDEFQVTDIADAMLLKNMFSLLFNKGIVVVATSNRAPLELYLDGLQRDLFLPFCHTLQRKSEVIRMRETRDYRMIKHETQEKKNVYFESTGTDPAFEAAFRSHTAGRRIFEGSLIVYGHKLNLPAIAAHPFADYMPAEREAQSGADRIAHSHNANIARFSFAQLCDENVGAADYIAVSQLFDIVFLERVPQLTTDCRNQIRRFITLVDALYEARVVVVVQAAAAAPRILDVSQETKRSSLLDELFSFDRCVSRLLEMQSEEYINGCAAFREANVRSRGAASESSAGRSASPQLPHAAEASLSLQDVAAYYSPWDLSSRQLHLPPAPLPLLVDAWAEVQSLAGDVSEPAPAAPPLLSHSHAEDNVIVYLNRLLDPAAHLSRLPLGALDALLQRVVHAQTGVRSFAPAESSARQLRLLLEKYDLALDSHSAAGGKHRYHFRRRGRHHDDDSKLFSTFSFNAFVAALHKHPIITLL